MVIYDVECEEDRSAAIERAVKASTTANAHLSTSFDLCRSVEDRLFGEIKLGFFKVAGTELGLSPEVHQMALE